MALRVGQVAERLRVAPRRVRELIAEGRLKATHHPTAYYWLVCETSLRQYVKKQKPKRGRPRSVDQCQST